MNCYLQLSWLKVTFTTYERSVSPKNVKKKHVMSEKFPKWRTQLPVKSANNIGNENILLTIIILSHWLTLTILVH